VALGGAFWDAGAQVFINQGTNRRWTDTLAAADAWLANGGHLQPG
jgi:aryl sulfotransferase